MGVGADDFYYNYAEVNDLSGLRPTDVSRLTNAESLTNPFVDASDLPVTVSDPQEAENNYPAPNLWDRFVAWLDSLFHLNVKR